MSERAEPTRSAAWKRWLSLNAYGLVTSTLFRARTPPETLRSRFERFGRSSRESLRRKYPDLRFDDHAAGSIRIEAVTAGAARSDAVRPVVLHLHGGAFVFGSLDSYRNRAMRLSHRFEAQVFLPEYRLAPEHPFPAALDDALAAYRHVRSLAGQRSLIVSGDSGGGGLAVSLLVRLRELGEPLPAGAILLSPWADLSVSGASVDTNRSRDRWLEREHLERWAS